MNAENTINLLKVNGYPFELKENQIIIKLACKFFLKLYFENDHIVKEDNVLKTYNWLTNGKSLKSATKIGFIGFSIYILFLALWYILDPSFFSSGGEIFFIVFAPLVLYPFIEFWYYNNRLSKIKKLLNLI